MSITAPRPALAGAVLLCALGLTTLTPATSAQSPIPLSGHELSGEAAANLVKRLIKGFGAAGLLKLQRLGPITRSPDPKPVLWHVVATDAQAQHYEAYVTPDQGRITLYRGTERRAGPAHLNSSQRVTAISIVYVAWPLHLGKVLLLACWRVTVGKSY